MEPEILPLPELFALTSRRFSHLVLDEAEESAHGPKRAEEKPIDEQLAEALEGVELLQKRVKENALFSAGEQIDEHPTSSLQYLLAHYYAGHFT